jgi:hypothetical protein
MICRRWSKHWQLGSRRVGVNSGGVQAQCKEQLLKGIVRLVLIRCIIEIEHIGRPSAFANARRVPSNYLRRLKENIN